MIFLHLLLKIFPRWISILVYRDFFKKKTFISIVFRTLNLLKEDFNQEFCNSCFECTPKVIYIITYEKKIKLTKQTLVQKYKTLRKIPGILCTSVQKLKVQEDKKSNIFRFYVLL